MGRRVHLKKDMDNLVKPLVGDNTVPRGMVLDSTSLPRIPLETADITYQSGVDEVFISVNQKCTYALCIVYST